MNRAWVAANSGHPGGSRYARLILMSTRFIAALFVLLMVVAAVLAGAVIIIPSMGYA